MYKKDVKMENINHWLHDLYTAMEDDGLEMNKFDWNNLDKQVMVVLEEFFNYPNYGNYN